MNNIYVLNMEYTDGCTYTSSVTFYYLSHESETKLNIHEELKLYLEVFGASQFDCGIHTIIDENKTLEEFKNYLIKEYNMSEVKFDTVTLSKEDDKLYVN